MRASRTSDYFERALFNGILASQDPADGHDDVLPVDAARLRAALSHAVRFVLVLHGIGHRESRALRREHLRAQRRLAVRESVHLASTLDWRERGITIDAGRRAFRTRTPRGSSFRCDAATGRCAIATAPAVVVPGDDDHGEWPTRGDEPHAGERTIVWTAAFATATSSRCACRCHCISSRCPTLLDYAARACTAPSCWPGASARRAHARLAAHRQ